MMDDKEKLVPVLRKSTLAAGMTHGPEQAHQRHVNDDQRRREETRRASAAACGGV